MSEDIIHSTITHESLYSVINLCASLPVVRSEVEKNHDDNQWWPLYLEDWRLRMLIAGWSTRVSYKMISTFQNVVADIEKIGYEEICNLSESALRNVIGPLGLFKTRRGYLLSLQEFVNKAQEGDYLLTFPNDELISIFAQNVKWAGYKVAQCAILYAKGYHCGIFPIDSGMKDKLGPCLGMELPKGAYAHESMRKEIEAILHQYSPKYQKLATKLGYNNLQIPKDRAPTWWAHLALIYFKRTYCNQHDPAGCPLRNDSETSPLMGSMCDRNNPIHGGVS
jgi:hypothetical protein